MPLYRIKYHVLSRRCCNAKPQGGVHQIEATSEDEAKVKLREIIPRARFEKVTIVEG